MPWGFFTRLGLFPRVVGVPLSVKMGLKNVLTGRGRTRALLPLSGAVIAIALVAGANMSIDLASRKLLVVALDASVIDMVVLEQGNEDIPEVVSLLEDMLWITIAEPVVMAWAYPEDRVGNWTPHMVPILGAEAGFERISTDLGLSPTDFDLGYGEALLTPALANKLGPHWPTNGSPEEIIEARNLNITLSLSDRIHDGENREFSFKIVGLCQLQEDSWAKSMLDGGLVLSWAQAADLVPRYGDPFSLASLPSPVPVWRGRTTGGMILVFVDEDRVMVPSDPERSRQNLNALKQEMEMFAKIPISNIWSPVDEAVQQYGRDLEDARPSFLVACLPVILLGVYLATIGFDLVFAQRRMDIALLKCRGLGRRQITNMLMVEAITLGLAAGVLGILLGSLVASTVILPIPSQARPPISLTDLATIGLSPLTAFLGSMLGIGILTAASLKVIRDLNRTSIIDSLGQFQGNLQESQPQAPGKAYSPTRDIVLVIAPVILYAAVLLERLDLATRIPTLIQSVLRMLAGIGRLAIPILPILLVLGLSGILTRGTRGAYHYLSRLLRPFLGGFQPLVARNLLRNRRRVSGVAVLIALSMAFGAFVLAYSQAEKEEDRVFSEFRVGSDLSIEDQESLVQEDDLLALEEVRDTSSMLIVRTEGPDLMPLLVLGLQPVDYGQCLRASSYMSRSLLRLLSELEDEENGVLVFRSRRWEPMERGDTIRLILGREDGDTVDGEAQRAVEVAFSLVGSFKYAPGIGESLINMGIDTFITNREYLEEKIPASSSTTHRILVRAEKGANLTVLANNIVSENPGLEPEDVRIGGEWGLRPDETTDIIFAFLRLEFVFTLLMATVGLCFVVYTSACEREREIGGQLARGLGRGQIAGLLAGESLVVALVGIAIGLPVGLGTAYVLRASNNMIHGITIPPVMPLDPMLAGMVILSLASLLAGSLASAIRIGRIRLNEILRTR